MSHASSFNYSYCWEKRKKEKNKKERKTSGTINFNFRTLVLELYRAHNSWTLSSDVFLFFNFQNIHLYVLLFLLKIFIYKNFVTKCRHERHDIFYSRVLDWKWKIRFSFEFNLFRLYLFDFFLQLYDDWINNKLTPQGEGNDFDTVSF